MFDGPNGWPFPQAAHALGLGESYIEAATLFQEVRVERCAYAYLLEKQDALVRNPRYPVFGARNSGSCIAHANVDETCVRLYIE